MYTARILDKFSKAGADMNPKYILLKYKIAKMESIAQKDLAEYLGVTEKTIYRWKKLKEKYPKIFEEAENK